MKKTYTINLSGKIFHIDEDALEKLQTYINTLKAYYTREEDGNEIMNDIENRIGELFTEYLKAQYREVVNISDVEQAIATMGSPNDIIDEDEQPQKTSSKQAKRLYRDPENRVLGGVAGGMAAYWGISPLLIRICFVIMAFYYGIFIIVYLILWCAVPKAKTTKQKLEMKGEDVNVSNIERSIKEEYQEIKNGKGIKYVNRVGSGFSEVVSVLGRILAITVGMGLFLGGLFLLFTFLSVLFLPNLYPWNTDLLGVTHAFSAINLILAKIAILFLIGIPILMIIYMAIKLLLSFRSNNKLIALSALSLWVLGFIMAIFVGISEGRSWSLERTCHEESIELNRPDTLEIRANERYQIPDGLFMDEEVIKFATNKMIVPKIRIYPTEDSLPRIDVKFYTHEVKPIADRMDFHWKETNDTLQFDNYIQLAGKWRAQSVILDIYLPDKQKILFTPQTLKYLRKQRNNHWQIRAIQNQNKNLFIMQDKALQAI